MGKNHHCQRLDKMRKKTKNAAAAVVSTDSVASDTTSAVSVDNLIGCPVPEPITCCQPKVDIDPMTAVKMECSNENCTFNEQQIYLHAECYGLFEDHLVKRLSTSGSARGWTDSQRRNNLWEKKGQALIGKLRRCRCGPGLLSIDKQALYEKEKNEKKKKEKNKKQKKENVGNKQVDENHRRNHRERAISVSSESSFMTNTTTTGNNSSLNFRKDSEISDISDAAMQVLLVPAPLPPVQTRSYASTIKSETDVSCATAKQTIVHNESNLSSSDDSLNSTHNDSGFGEKTPPAPPPSLLHLHFNSTPNSFVFNSPDMNAKINNNNHSNNNNACARQQPLTSTPRLINRSLNLFIKEQQMKENEKKNLQKVEPMPKLQYGWTPFFGQDFNFGERLMYFP
ncbi:unnamed protein product [Caenorhabditis angaria]|uniref:Headcase N-terminal domain-containing protein n=1 Tax=Caenorhabditis angaria TaxID=860376 RepID=A0A9P1N6T5_9PELO|nr:unnamed protein product [Caenorhabditis angaria]